MTRAGGEMERQKEQYLHIQAGRTKRQYADDIWRYRELFWFLAWRDILVRYKQTVMGVIWAVIRPFLTMMVFTVVFSKIAGLPSDGAAPYPILVYAALLPWQFFASALQESSSSLISNANMISKVYFPRIIVPISSIIVCLVDFLVSFTILICLMVFYHYTPSPQIMLLPLFTMVAFFAALGFGILLSALNVKYRDFRYVVPFILQIGLYISPVGFSSAIIPSGYRAIYALNPMVGVIDGFRWCIIGNVTLNPVELLISFSLVAAVVFAGVAYFRKVERTFADII